MTACSTGFQRPSCLQQSLKFLQPNLAPFLPAVNAPASCIYRSVAAAAATKQTGAQVPGAHGQRRTHPQSVAQ